MRRLAPVEVLPSGEIFSFAHAFLDANKRSVAIDPDSAAGAEALSRLLANSDVVIVTPDDGASAEVTKLVAAAKERPRLIVASITPFGLGGPYAHRQATDLVMLASGGLPSFWRLRR